MSVRDRVTRRNPALDVSLDGVTSMTTRSRQIKVASYLLLSLVAVFYIWPLFMLVNTSMKTLPEYLRDPSGLASQITFENFAEAWAALAAEALSPSTPP